MDAAHKQDTKTGAKLSPIERLLRLVRYLGQSKVRIEQELDKKTEQHVNYYEQEIQQLEAKIREHIRIEQQMRLYIDDVKAQLIEHQRLLKHEKDNSSLLSKELQFVSEKLNQMVNLLVKKEKDLKLKKTDQKQDALSKTKKVEKVSLANTLKSTTLGKQNSPMTSSLLPSHPPLLKPNLLEQARQVVFQTSLGGHGLFGQQAGKDSLKLMSSTGSFMNPKQARANLASSTTRKPKEDREKENKEKDKKSPKRESSSDVGKLFKKVTHAM